MKSALACAVTLVEVVVLVVIAVTARNDGSEMAKAMGAMEFLTVLGAFLVIDAILAFIWWLTR